MSFRRFTLALALTGAVLVASACFLGGGGGTRPVTAANVKAYPVELAPFEFKVFILSNHRAPLADTAPGWWKDAVTYVVYPRSFYDSDGNGVGDLAGLTAKLDYVTNLGFDAVWTLPVHHGYHDGSAGRALGYEAVNYYDIDPDYGKMADYERYVAAAHARGVKVIMDMVINHTALSCEWFKRSEAGDPAYKNWYTWRDGVRGADGKVDRAKSIAAFEKEGWMLPWGGRGAHNVWHWSEKRQQFWYAAWGAEPDFKNTAVRQEFLRVAEFWLKKGADGFRLDAIRYLIEEGPYPKQADTPSTMAYLRELQARIKQVKPEAMTVGEVWSGPPDIAKYFQGGKGLDICFDFPYHDAGKHGMSSGYPGQLQRWMGADSMRYIEEKVKDRVPRDFFAPFLDNHDVKRVMAEIREAEGRRLGTRTPTDNWAKARLAAAVLLTSRGAPYVYFGSEIGLIGQYNPMQWGGLIKEQYQFTKGRPWMGFPDRDPARTVAAQIGTKGSLLNTYKQLIALRKASPALRRGDLRLVTAGSRNVLAYLRPGPEGSVLVVANFGDKAVDTTLDLATGGVAPTGPLALTAVPFAAGQE